MGPIIFAEMLIAKKRFSANVLRSFDKPTHGCSSGCCCESKERFEADDEIYFRTLAILGTYLLYVITINI